MTHYGFLSTYPPTRCGLATFTASLAGALLDAGDQDATVVRVLDGPEPPQPALLGARARVRTDLIAGDRLSTVRSALALSACDVAIVQHEYGIFGGRDGDQVLEVLAAVTAPTVVVLHTVLAAPTAHQRHVLRQVCLLATTVVVMTENARAHLGAHYAIDLTHVHVIPHGVAHLAAPAPAPREGHRILTWGLISPGKGIEWGIRALTDLADLAPAVEYVVAGQTHPKVLAHAGESYRSMLTDLAADLGVADQVHLDGRYLDEEQLADLVASADIVLLPYDSRDQATSGVLAEAVAAGVPVIATRFPHAVELLGGGAGIIVTQRDAPAMAAAVREILTDLAVADHMRDAARQAAGDTSWDAVASRYRALADGLIAAQAA